MQLRYDRTELQKTRQAHSTDVSYRGFHSCFPASPDDRRWPTRRLPANTSRNRCHLTLVMSLLDISKGYFRLYVFVCLCVCVSIHFPTFFMPLGHADPPCTCQNCFQSAGSRWRCLFASVMYAECRAVYQFPAELPTARVRDRSIPESGFLLALIRIDPRRVPKGFIEACGVFRVGVPRALPRSTVIDPGDF